MLFDTPPRHLRYQGKALIAPSDFSSVFNPFDYLMKLREGRPMSLLSDIGLKPDDAKVREVQEKYGIPLAAIGTSEEELTALVLANIKLRAAEHLVMMRSGMGSGLHDLKQFEAIRARLQVSYKALHTSSREVSRLRAKLHRAAAKNLLAELRLPKYLDNPLEGFDKFDEHLKAAGISYRHLRTSKKAIDELKRLRLIYKCLWLIDTMKQGLGWPDVNGNRREVCHVSHPLGSYLAQFEELRTQLKLSYEELETSAEEFQLLRGGVAMDNAKSALDWLHDTAKMRKRKKGALLPPARLKEFAKTVEDAVTNDDITYEDLGLTEKKFRTLKRRLDIN